MDNDFLSQLYAAVVSLIAWASTMGVLVFGFIFLTGGGAGQYLLISLIALCISALLIWKNPKAQGWFSGWLQSIWW